MKVCSDCPFKVKSPLVGSPDWLKDVFECYQKNPFFQHSCHKTDPKADGFKGGKQKDCKGWAQMMFNEIDKSSGRNGVYKNVNHLMTTYLEHWLGEKELSRIAKGLKPEEKK